MARRFMTLIAAAAALLSIGSPPQEDGGGAPCPDIIMSLVDCLSYVEVGDAAKRPSAACCSSVADVLEDVPMRCVCQALESARETGFMVNMTRAVHLPVACNLNAPKFQCQAAPSHAPSPSPNPAPSPSSTARRPISPSPWSPSTPLSPSRSPSTPPTPSSPSPSPSTPSTQPSPSPSTPPTPSSPSPSPSTPPTPSSPSPSSPPVSWTPPPSISPPSPTPQEVAPQSSAATVTPAPAPVQNLNDAPMSPYAPKLVALLLAAGCALFLAP